MDKLVDIHEGIVKRSWSNSQDTWFPDVTLNNGSHSKKMGSREEKDQSCHMLTCQRKFFVWFITQGFQQEVGFSIICHARMTVGKGSIAWQRRQQDIQQNDSRTRRKEAQDRNQDTPRQLLWLTNTRHKREEKQSHDACHEKKRNLEKE